MRYVYLQTSLIWVTGQVLRFCQQAGTKFKQARQHFICMPAQLLNSASAFTDCNSIACHSCQACTASTSTTCDAGATATFVDPEDANSRVIACLEHTNVEEPRSFQVGVWSGCVCCMLLRALFLNVLC